MEFMTELFVLVSSVLTMAVLTLPFLKKPKALLISNPVQVEEVK